MYYFDVKLNDSFDNTVKRVTEALQQQKFGILNEINVDAVLKNKLEINIPRYRILHACNPAFAHRLISIDPAVGVLLPCNVLVREESESTTTVVFMDPVTVFGLTQNQEVIRIIEEAKTLLMCVREQLATS